MSVDKSKVLFLVEQAKGYLKQIETMDLKKLDDVGFDALSMRLFSLLNKIIDLSEEVVKGEELGMPMKIRDLFELLRKGKIISSKMCLELSDLVFLRNGLSHRYDSIDENRVIGVAKDLGTVRKFMELIEKRYKKI